MSAAFSSNDSDVISRKLNITDDVKSIHDDLLEAHYELEKCVNWIHKNSYERTALQFPDNLLVDAARIATAIGRSTDCKISILADTSYGSCCVDEVAAQHFNADSIIHFGHSCLSSTSRLPVLYVFGKATIDSEKFIEKFISFSGTNELSSPAIIWVNVIYYHAIDEIQKLMQVHDKSVIVPVLDVPNEIPNTVVDGDCSREIKYCGRTFNLPSDKSLEDCDIVYVGPDDLALLNVVMNFNKNAVYCYDPVVDKFSKFSRSVNKMLMRRYHLIETAKDAKIIGILVGTLGVTDYMSVIDRAKKTIKAAGKKSYLFVMGKINVAKLANFLEIDVYVLVACPENSMIDSRNFYRPIITPFELEIACNEARQWTGDYITDFTQLLPGSKEHIAISQDTEERVDVSLISGRIRSLGVKNEVVSRASDEVVSRDSVMTVDIHRDSAGEFLSSRSWKGLEQKLGETSVEATKEGRSGIPSQYVNEPDVS